MHRLLQDLCEKGSPQAPHSGAGVLARLVYPLSTDSTRGSGQRLLYRHGGSSSGAADISNASVQEFGRFLAAAAPLNSAVAPPHSWSPATSNRQGTARRRTSRRHLLR